MNSEEIEQNLEELIGEWVNFVELSEHLDVPITRVHNMVNDRRLLAFRAGERKIRVIPQAFLTESGILESLRGTVLVLIDAGFSDEQALQWLFTPDDTLPGTPVDALRSGRKTEVRRRAQALAW